MPQHGLPILKELIILLAVSLPITYLFHRAKLPALVGFMITGVFIGPYGASIITDTSAVERLAEIGVVLLLFTVGLEFSLTDIMRSARQLLLGGGTQARDGGADLAQGRRELRPRLARHPVQGGERRIQMGKAVAQLWR